MNAVNLLPKLVENAIDFLQQSIRELKRQPKYSVIHFHAAVELFLKARLMAEHWSLVVSNAKDADWDEFDAGNFRSVSLNEAAAKLRKVVRSGLSERELETFREVAKHRNRMMHFFHEDVTGDKKDGLRRAIAKEQLTAWYYLHRRLTSEWSDVFSAWSGKLGKIDRKLRRLREFLQVVFDELQPEIERRCAGGSLFNACPSCGFVSQEHSREIGRLYKAECLVCGLADKCLTIECTECSAPTRFVNEGIGECVSCSRSFEPEAIVRALIDSGAACVDELDEGYTPDPGNCDSCNGYHSVARLSDNRDRYICMSCFGEFDSVHSCEWCNELNTGDMADSFWAGCNLCDGFPARDQDA